MIYILVTIAAAEAFVIFCLKSQRDDCRKKAARYKKAYNEMLGEFNAMFASNFSTFVEKFFEDTEVQNYSIQVSQDRLDVKIGDEQLMVKVDPEMLVKDVVGALEQAQIEWTRLKYGK